MRDQTQAASLEEMTFQAERTAETRAPEHEIYSKEVDLIWDTGKHEGRNGINGNSYQYTEPWLNWRLEPD